MGIGYPDFFGQSVFLKYGVTKQKNISQKMVNEDETNTDLLVNAKGKITGGYITLYNIDITDIWAIQLLLDGQSSAKQTNKAPYFDYLNSLINYPLVIVQENYSTGIIVIELQGEVTFDESAALWISSLNGSFNFNAQICYTEVIE